MSRFESYSADQMKRANVKKVYSTSLRSHDFVQKKELFGSLTLLKSTRYFTYKLWYTIKICLHHYIYVALTSLVRARADGAFAGFTSKPCAPRCARAWMVTPSNVFYYYVLRRVCGSMHSV